MASSFELSNPNRTIHIGVFLPLTTTEILDVAPVDLFAGLQPHFLNTLPPHAVTPGMKNAALDSEIHWVSELGEPGRLTSGVKAIATDSFSSCPNLDILVIGAPAGNYIPSDAETAFLHRAKNNNCVFITVCGGFSLLLHAGLLHGKNATAPRIMLKGLQEQVPVVNWVDRRWVHDNGIWTCGALLHGIDLVAEFVRSTWTGGDRGRLIQWILEFGGWNVGRDVNYVGNEGLVPPQD